MDLTKQEIEVLKRITSAGKWDQWIWEFVYLVPSMALIVFGALNISAKSIFVGAGLLATIRIMSAYQQFKEFHIYKGLCDKIYDQYVSVRRPDQI